MKLTPNHITNFRMVCVPLVAVCVLIDGKFFTTLAFMLFVLAAISDWYDGYLARATNTTSIFGQVFDSIADKLLIGACIVALAYVGRMGNGLIFPALIILLREIFIAGLREYVIRIHAEGQLGETVSQEVDSDDRKPLGTTNLARIKAALQMVGIGMLIIAPYLLHPYFGMLGGLIFWVSAALSLYTGWQYWLEAKPTFIRKVIST